MNLAELGFHKCAGIQADIYTALKPSVLKALNSRRPTETKRRLAVMLKNLLVTPGAFEGKGGQLLNSLPKTRGPHTKLSLK